ncbi:MAG: ATP-binding cassette domain-containing protein [Candidatus Binatus sp.]|uniref:ATP-binding cassette domain-containing protein n=1 Tax=Candidatus Binatus sp. TaxID=2811406 RepID=UPI003C76DE0E
MDAESKTTPPGSQKSTDPALQLESVSKSFHTGGRNVRALDHMSIEVRRGIVTGLIGPDGAGKTTLMRLVAGLLAPDEGAIHVLGIDALSEPQRVQSIVGYMPQRFGLYEDLSVQENLDLYADLHAVAQAERYARYSDLMRMTGLAPFTNRLAGKLSGGMKQKLGLACSLVGSPPLLLLDEPTVGVDPVSRRELWAIIHRLVEERGATVLLSTAYLDEAERCTEVILMHDGKLLGQDDPAAFTRRLAGRSFQVFAPGISKRSLQERISRAPGILDAIIQGSRIRVVTEQPVAPTAAQLVDGEYKVEITPVAPRFEDSFVSLLKGSVPSPQTAPVRTAGKSPSTGVATDADVIVVHDLSRRFGEFYAVRDVNFTVRRGEVFGLLGANGAGKSTTFRMLCGLLPASEGTLRVAGVDLRRAAAQARGRVGYMAQKFSLYGDLSVFENLRFFSAAYGLRGAHQRKRLDWALDEFELGPFANATSRDLPLGFKQRLALAVALMHEPDILFLDEPTSGVDPLGRRDFWRRINALAESGITIMVTTHFMEEAEYCDRLVIMAQGRILAEGTSEEMKARFRSDALPNPTMEDAFVALITAAETHEAVAAA